MLQIEFKFLNVLIYFIQAFFETDGCPLNDVLLNIDTIPDLRVTGMDHVTSYKIKQECYLFLI